VATIVALSCTLYSLSLFTVLPLTVHFTPSHCSLYSLSLFAVLPVTVHSLPLFIVPPLTVHCHGSLSHCSLSLHLLALFTVLPLTVHCTHSHCSLSFLFYPRTTKLRTTLDEFGFIPNFVFPIRPKYSSNVLQQLPIFEMKLE
jgi:hypothetical protein